MTNGRFQEKRWRLCWIQPAHRYVFFFLSQHGQSFYASLFIEQPSVAAEGFSSGMKAYISAIPFCFYPIIILLIVLLFSLGIMPKLGGMKKAYQRVAETGKVYSDASRKYNHEDRAGYEEEGNIWDFVIPMAVLVAIAIITGDLLLAVVLSIACCALIYLPRKIIAVNEFFGIIVKGFADMLPTLTLLVLAFLLQKVTEQLNMTDYIINLAEPLLTGSLFPNDYIYLSCSALFCDRFLLGNECSSCTDCISAWSSNICKSGFDNGSHHFRRRFWKPCMLLL